MLCRYSENVTQELKGTAASDVDRQRMVEILQMFQAGEDDSALPANAAEEDDEEDDGGKDTGDLSDETVAKLVAKVGLSHRPPFTACVLGPRGVKHAHQE